MNRAAPPRNGEPSTPLSIRGPKLKRFYRSKYNLAWRNASIAYTAIVIERYHRGLRSPFSSYRCGGIGLDPLGFDGPNKTLCWRCAE
jgi:hypothetical protein